MSELVQIVRELAQVSTLAQLIADNMDDTPGQKPAQQDMELAAAIWAAGYRKSQ